MKKYCGTCGKEIDKCVCENKNESNIRSIFKGIGFTIILFLSYLLIPTFIATLTYQTFKISESLASFIGNLVYIISVIYYFRKLFKKDLLDYKKNFGKYLGNSFKYWGIGLAVMMVTNLIINVFVFKGQIANNEEINRAFLESYKVIGFIQIVFMAPIIEELIFRYGISKITRHKYIYPLLSALAFGLPHALTNITTPLALLYVIPYGALGYAFAALYNKTDNIITNISMHATHNLLVYLVIILAI